VAVTAFSGLASGIDTASIVKSLVSVERLPITRIEQKKTILNTQSGKFTALKDLLVKLQDSAKGMKLRPDVLSSAATSSNEKSATVKADGAATIGSFKLDVINLASTQRNHSDPFASKTATGQFSWDDLRIQVGGGEEVVIETDENTTLESLATSINKSGADVTASVVFSEGAYRLQVSGKNTGAANTVTFSGTVADELGIANNVVREAKDASFEIDDLPMTSATNTVTDALAGVTLTLKGTTAEDESTTIEVTRDNAAIKTKVQGFVDAYNAVAKQINTEFAYTGTAQTGATLSGDATLRTIQTKLRGLLGTPASGVTGQYTTLASIGIKTQSDGTLKIDDKAFDDVLGKNPEAVAAMLTEDKAVGSVGVFAQVDNTLKEMLTGENSPLSLRISSIAARVKAMGVQVDRMELHMDKYEENLNKQFTAMELMMSKLQSQGNQLSSMMSAF
jgi:flagellar hook-associated protein 2